jgi:hypothetical protein
MHSQGEFTESIGGRVVESARFEPSPCPLETEAQRQMFIGVAQRAQKSAHLVRALTGGADRFQRGGQFRFTCRDRLEQRALKLAAARGAFGVDAAVLPAQSAAQGWGNFEFRVSAFE